ncbi:HPF/RaiA family ribosome-associated protein [Sphingopyxis solisilvae]|uniref:HPF/RaiA family ribosome-associated protein n=1 Tax=Sphingopyxis solisilvae TaxID=1886788 RepID=UPI001892B753|nr:HPF/RaiA family ribosome-associated protein [Sphingopyxis solisilvae]MCW5647912.1 HPF/RaiA family ribosome-associated protein [Sphingopyxis sp.]
MQILVNTDNRTPGPAGRTAALEQRIGERLNRFSSRLSRVEAHIRDVDGDTNGARGMEARLEARPNGGDPLSAKADGVDAEQALNNALAAMISRLDSHFGKADRVRP